VSQVILYYSSSLTKKHSISQVTIFVKKQNYVLSQTSSEFYKNQWLLSTQGQMSRPKHMHGQTSWLKHMHGQTSLVFAYS